MADRITGLANRRGFDLAIGNYWQDTTHIGSRLSPILIDLDHFKEVNDDFGHQASDDCLRVIAVVLQSAMVAHDAIAALWL